MGESLWQAVQEEAVKTTSPTPQKPIRPVRAEQRTGVQRSQRPNRRKSEPKVERPFPRQQDRIVDRHPYDFYRDQVLWLKRTKLDIEQQYGVQITANAMVQLAMDLLIADYERNRQNSKLVKRLVRRPG